MTPDPRLRSRRSRGTRNCRAKSSPKNRRINDSSIGPPGPPGPPGLASGERTTFEDEILTTAGAALRTTGEKPRSNTVCECESDPTLYPGFSGRVCALVPVTPPTSSASPSAAAATQVGVCILFCIVLPLEEGLYER